MNLPRYVLEIIQTINQAGYDAFVVGGCVRDALLQIEPQDYDIATNARPEQIQSLFSHTIPTGIRHGTMTVLSKQPVEITTYRIESAYTDHRHPDQVEFVSHIEDDLSRRDFTINAMAYHPQIGLIDPFHGQKDLKAGIIRCVGDPDVRFCEDALRMLRAHRFAAAFHFAIDRETRQAIQRHQADIQYIAVERIRKELIRILEADPYQVEQMTTLLHPWIPELEACKNCQQNTPYHDTDVLHHILRAVALLDPFDETLAYALLFHDLAKPMMRTTRNGIDHFKGHPVRGADIARRICKDLKLSNQQKKIIPALVYYHDEKIKDPLVFIHKFRINLSWNHAWMMALWEVKRCDILAHSAYGQRTIQQVKNAKHVYETSIGKRPMCLADLAIDGNDVIEQAGIQGKRIHLVLKTVLDICFYQPVMNRKDALIAYIRSQSWKY